MEFKSIKTMAQKPSKTSLPPPTMDILIKYMGDVNASIASIQQGLDDMKKDILKRIDDLESVQKDQERALTVRVSTVGNQVHYFRETICSSVQDVVSEIVLKLNIDAMY